MERLSFSEFLDVVWAHVLSGSPAMANPFDYRESMKVAFGMSDKTHEQLERERDARDRELNKPTKGRGGRPLRSVPTVDATPRQSELDKLSALMSSAKPRLKPPPE